MDACIVEILLVPITCKRTASLTSRSSSTRRSKLSPTPEVNPSQGCSTLLRNIDRPGKAQNTDEESTNRLDVFTSPGRPRQTGNTTTDPQLIDSQSSLSCKAISSKTRSTDEPSILAQNQRQTLMNALERSENFLPWTYTTMSDHDTISSFDAHELVVPPFHGMAIGHYIRRKHCSLLYFKESRKWIRLSVTLTVTRDSKYWDIEKSKVYTHYKTHQGISSGHLQSMIKDFLATCMDVSAYSHLAVFLGANPESHECKIVKPVFHAKAYLTEVTRRLRHWNCRWFQAAEVKHIAILPWLNERLFFSAFLDGRVSRLIGKWVEQAHGYHMRFDSASIHPFWNVTRADLFCLPITVGVWSPIWLRSVTYRP